MDISLVSVKFPTNNGGDVCTLAWCSELKKMVFRIEVSDKLHAEVLLKSHTGFWNSKTEIQAKDTTITAPKMFCV
jgi:hypothetical protein